MSRADPIGRVQPRAARLPGWVAAIAGAQFLVLIATSTRYGFHRDELYFIVAGSHPALGYPDQPALVPLVSWAMHGLAPGSPLTLRLPSALAAAATTLIAALVAREAGGGRRAQVIAAACTAVSGFALAVGHFVTTTTFDLLSTTALVWLLIRAIARRSGATVLAAGVVVGIGFEAKPQVGFVAIVAVAALLVIGPRWVLRSWWAAGGIAAALVLAAPYVIWQQRHGWPQLTVAGNVAGSAEGGRIGFVPFQLLMVSPVLVPVWVAGLLAPFRREALRPLRFVPLLYGVLAVAYVIGNGKAYYLASLYPVLLGLGAVPTADWTARARSRVGLLTAAIALSAVVSAVIALPLLPERSLQGSIVMAVNPDQGETVGWPRFVGTVATAWDRISRRRAAADGDLHEQLRRGRRGRRPRRRARPAARLQRPQRLQQLGPAGRGRHPDAADRLRRGFGRRAVVHGLSPTGDDRQRRRPRQRRAGPAAAPVPAVRVVGGALAPPHPLQLRRPRRKRRLIPAGRRPAGPGRGPFPPGRAAAGHRRTRFLSTNRRLAGRSASRRIRYGYHSGPYGVATSTEWPSAASDSCSCGRTP